MGQLLAVLVLVLAAPAHAVQEDGVHRETYPDGSRVEVEVERRGSRTVRDGKYRRVAPDGVVLEEGRYRDGRAQGKWTFRHANGEERARGYFDQGVPTREWRLRRADGEVLAKGEVEGDPPVGTFAFLGAEGEPDPAHSGAVRAFEERWPSGAPRHRGMLLDGRPHGRWTGCWSDGSLREEGVYVRGERVGPWRFFHADGTPDHALLGDDGAALEWFAWPTPDDHEPAPEPPAGGALARLGPEPDADVERLLAALRSPQASVREPALAEVRSAGAGVVPVLIDALAALDPADAEAAPAAGRLAGALAAACGGRGFGWSAEATAAEENRLRVRRWHSLGSLTWSDRLVWDVAFAPPARPEEARLDLDVLTRGIRTRPPAAPWAESAPLEVVSGVGRALDWLARHQDASGRWSPSDFGAHCVARGEPACEGAGHGAHEVGVTGLALLAFLHAGHGLEHGSHDDAVVGAVAWLLRQQTRTGLYGERRSFEHVYSHCIATWALSEALTTVAAPERVSGLRASVQRGVDAIQGMRNRGDVPGWRYELAPGAEADTSVTGWAVHALVAAHRAGLQVDPEALAAGVALVERMTGDEGRVGYDSPGSPSARTPENVERFPHDGGEAMTAIGVLVRTSVAEATGTPADAAALRRHAALLRPPAWEPEGRRDFYYWMWGAEAARALGDGTWRSWADALRTEVAHRQEQHGETGGSWTATSAWSEVGGRVYATAALALALSCAAR